VTYKTALVVGGGIGGLMTARALSDSFEQVLVLDRDSMPAEPGIRNGAPQGNHFHAILPGGLEIMNQFFPGFDSDIEQQGSLTPTAREFYFYGPEGKSYNAMRFQPEPVEPPPDFPKTHIQTRGLLEHSLRKRTEAIANITTRYETMVRDPIVQDGNITGVVIADAVEELHADLVVDASGRVSRTLGWLTQAGKEQPSVSEIHCDFAYTTIRFLPRDPSLFTDVGFFMGNDPNGEHPKRGGALIRMEDGTLMATVSGRLGDYPPRDVEGFMAYAETLIEPSFLKIIKDADPITEPHHFKFPKSVRRHYEKMTSFPGGLLPIADAICHYNPVYGQGMSAASRQARALGEIVATRKANGQGLDGLWKDFFPRAFEETRAPWLFAALADLAIPGTEGDFPVDEQRTLERMIKMGALATEGDIGCMAILGNIQVMRLPLSALHDEATLERFGVTP
jgi:2-polyprenyl-6-methoxyphenol hydroxylase-like FAD-dependent oxidoreductase